MNLIQFFHGENMVCESQNVNFLCPFNGIINGTVGVTTFRLMFFTPKDVILDLPLGVINRIEKFGNQSTVANPGDNNYGIVVYCKDLRYLRFSFPARNHSRRTFYEQLYKSVFPLNINLPLWAFYFTEPFETNGWSVYDPIREYQRLGVPDENWRLTHINADYKFCETYPSLLCVPRGASEDLLRSVAKYRSRQRIPVLCWKWPTPPIQHINLEHHSSPQSLKNLTTTTPSDACILRGAQPLSGLSLNTNQNASSQSDREYIKLLVETNAHYSQNLAIFDARPRINAVANKAKGGGYESEEQYPDTEFIFLDIANIHVMRDSLKKLQKECFPFVDETHWLTKLESTHWLDHIRAILFGALRIVDKVDNQQTSVFIHCSDGWDRTAQLTSLAMLMLDPYYRTIEGFEVLLEKEWISFGHKFSQRFAHGWDNHDSTPTSLTNKNLKNQSTSKATPHTSSINLNDLSNTSLPIKTYINDNLSTLTSAANSKHLHSRENNDIALRKNFGKNSVVGLRHSYAVPPPSPYDNNKNNAYNGINDEESTSIGGEKSSVSAFSLPPLSKINATSSSINVSTSTAQKKKKSLDYTRFKNKASEVSPVFLQFMDCVFQLTRQFPQAFEFDQTLLIYILDNLHSCLFGTFLGNCERERVEILKVKMNTQSLWSAINSNLNDFINPFYINPFAPKSINSNNMHTTNSKRELVIPRKCVLYPIVTIRHLEFWNAYYLRWNPYTKCQQPNMQEKYKRLNTVKRDLEQQVYELTQKLNIFSAGTSTPPSLGLSALDENYIFNGDIKNNQNSSYLPSEITNGDNTKNNLEYFIHNATNAMPYKFYTSTNPSTH